MTRNTDGIRSPRKARGAPKTWVYFIQMGEAYEEAFLSEMDRARDPGLTLCAKCQQEAARWEAYQLLMGNRPQA